MVRSSSDCAEVFSHGSIVREFSLDNRTEGAPGLNGAANESRCGEASTYDGTDNGRCEIDGNQNKGGTIRVTQNRRRWPEDGLDGQHDRNDACAADGPADDATESRRDHRDGCGSDSTRDQRDDHTHGAVDADRVREDTQQQSQYDARRERYCEHNQVPHLSQLIIQGSS